MQNYGMNLFFATAWLIMVTLVFAPKVVGEWEAKRDIAYDSIMSEYWMDCDCTEPLDKQ